MNALVGSNELGLTYNKRRRRRRRRRKRRRRRRKRRKRKRRKISGKPIKLCTFPDSIII